MTNNKANNNTAKPEKDNVADTTMTDELMTDELMTEGALAQHQATALAELSNELSWLDEAVNQLSTVTTDESYPLNDGTQFKLTAFTDPSTAIKEYSLCRKTMFGWLSRKLYTAVDAEERNYIWTTGTSTKVDVEYDDVIKDQLLFVPIAIHHYRYLLLNDNYAPAPFYHVIGFRIPTLEEIKDNKLTPDTDVFNLHMMSFLIPTSSYEDCIKLLVLNSAKAALIRYISTVNPETGEKYTPKQFSLPSAVDTPDSVALKTKLISEQIRKPIQFSIKRVNNKYGLHGYLQLNQVAITDESPATYKAVCNLAEKWLEANDNNCPKNDFYVNNERDCLAKEAA